jgi:hypothetical protein
VRGRERLKQKSDKARTTVAAEKPTKFKFKRLKVEVLTILDEQKKEVGSVRVEPGEIAWKPAGESRWYTLPIREFGKYAVAHGVRAETGK